MISLDNESLYYVALQRTHYQSKINRLFWKAGLRGWYEKNLLGLVERLRKQKLAELYELDLQSDFNTFSKHLPHSAATVLDIGCGIGGIDVLIDRHFSSKNEKPNFVLLDTDGRAKKSHFGYAPKDSAHNALAATERFAVRNRIERERLTLVNINQQSFPKDRRFDVVLSLLSWGFHYPVNEYAALVHETLSKSGVVILDVRKNSSGEEDLKRHFDSVDRIFESEKFFRVACRGPK